MDVERNDGPLSSTEWALKNAFESEVWELKFKKQFQDNKFSNTEQVVLDYLEERVEELKSRIPTFK